MIGVGEKGRSRWVNGIGIPLLICGEKIPTKAPAVFAVSMNSVCARSNEL